MCLFNTPQPQQAQTPALPAPSPTMIDPNVQRARRDARMTALASSSNNSGYGTSPFGLPNFASTTANLKTLMGQ